jgi:hypothetical protein
MNLTIKEISAEKMKGDYYSGTINHFLSTSVNELLDIITGNINLGADELCAKEWELEIEILKEALTGFSGTVYFGY